MIKKIHIKKYRFIFFVLFLILILLPFRNILEETFVDGHDFLLHFHLIYTLEENIRNGILFPRWLSNATFGYGSPIMTFMWGVPYYLGVFLHMAGFSYSNVFRLLLILPNLAAGFGMYLWLKNKFGRLTAGIAALIYIWTPYRFVDTFIRGALGELFFFALLPFLFYFIDSSLSFEFIFLGIIAVALMIYSHQGLSLIGFLIILAYIITKFILKRDRNLLVKRLFVMGGGLILSAFFWLPAIAYHSLLPFGETISKEWFPPLLSLIRSPWEGGMVRGRWLIFSFQIGLTQLSIIFLSHLTLIYCFYKNRVEKVWLIFWLSLFWLSLFFLQPVSSFFWEHIPLLAYLQFPFRLLFIPMFTSAILVSFSLNLFKGTKKYILGIIIVIFVIIANRNHLAVLPKVINIEELSAYNGTYDVGGEKIPKYANVKTITEEYKNGINKDEFFLLNGKGTILKQKRENYLSSAELSLEKDSAVFIRRIYFPGWTISVNGKKLQQRDFSKGNGIIVPLKSGRYTIKAQYNDPLLVTFSNLVSISFFLILILVMSARIIYAKINKR